MISTRFLASAALLLLHGVAAMPENCCTLAAQFYNPKTTKVLEQCQTADSVYGTKRWVCSKGDVTYNGSDLENGIGPDLISMHVNPDREKTIVHFTVMMECTGKSGALQRALPLYCPSFSTRQTAGLGPIFDEPCADTPKVYSIEPLAESECSVLTLAESI